LVHTACAAQRWVVVAQQGPGPLRFGPVPI